jgi:hypothetical protein
MRLLRIRNRWCAGFLIAKYELYSVVFAVGIAMLAYLASGLLLVLLPAVRIMI